MVGKQSLLFPNYCLLQSSSLKEVFFFCFFFLMKIFIRGSQFFRLLDRLFRLCNKGKHLQCVIYKVSDSEFLSVFFITLWNYFTVTDYQVGI